jgi:hypothetical protein
MLPKSAIFQEEFLSHKGTIRGGRGYIITVGLVFKNPASGFVMLSCF